MFGGALRRLHLLAPAEDGDHAAKVAPEGTADGRLKDSGPPTEDRRMKILGNVDLVIGRRGKIVRAFPRPLRTDVMRAVREAERDPRDTSRVALAVDRFEQF